MQQTAAVRLATQIALTLIDANEIPDGVERTYDPLEDYWVAIAHNWDLNVWWDEDTHTYKATIYPVVVVSGICHTITDTFVSLNLDVPLLLKHSRTSKDSAQ